MQIFITTHSHVVIDLFSKDNEAQILHVSTDPVTKTGRVETINERISHNIIFEDLDVRASDLLQSNCIIWVEGPSDRIYFNRWIELIDPVLQEHIDYEFAFTSGTLIAYQTFDSLADAKPDVEEMIQTIKINRNVIVLMDRDWRDGKLKDWVARVEKEVIDSGGIAWVTAGKEVENYIPVDALREFTENPELPIPGLEENILTLIHKNGRANYAEKKPQLARLICPRITLPMLTQTFDLEKKIKEVCELIRKWNSRPID